MSFWNRIKRVFSPSKLIETSIRPMDAANHFGLTNRRWSYYRAVRQFHGWAYAFANLNASAVCNVPIRLYVRKRDARTNFETRRLPKRMERHIGQNLRDLGGAARSKYVEWGGHIEEVVEPHPILKLLNTGNEWMNGDELLNLLMLDLQITGNGYWHRIMDRTLNVPIELWRMPPHFVTIRQDRQKWVGAYIYGADLSIAKEFPPDEVSHFKLPNPDDQFYGKGWYEAAWSAVGLDEEKRKTDTAKFANYARPDWFLTVKNGGTKEQLDRIKNEVNEKMKGSEKAGNFMVGAGDWQATNLNWDIPEVGSATRVIEEIAACSGVPVAMALTNDPNRANSEAARLGWYRNTIKPYTRRIAEKLNSEILPLFEGSEDVFLAFDHVSFEDTQAQAKRAVGLVAGGIMTPNEMREEDGYPPHEDGDELYPPSGGAGVSGTGEDNAPGQNNDRQNEAPTAAAA